MAYRKPVSVSLPPPLVKEVGRLAKRQHQTISELVRAALRHYMSDVRAQAAAWKRARSYGAQRAKELGLRTEADVQAILDELRHGQAPARHATARRR